MECCACATALLQHCLIYSHVLIHSKIRKDKM